MLRCGLLGQKWILENVESIFHKIVCYPDFMWVEDVDAFGAKTVFPETTHPWVTQPHLLADRRQPGTDRAAWTGCTRPPRQDALVL